MAGKIDGVFVELKATVDDAGVVKAEQKITNSAKKIQAEFKKTDTSLSRTNTQLARQSKNTAKSAKSMGGMGRSAGQASIQLQQFTGQVSGGVNPLIAFSQQAADLGIVMGAPLLGSIVGIGAAIGVVLLPELFKSTSAVEDLEKAMESLDKVATQTDGGVIEFTTSIKKLMEISRNAAIAELEVGLLRADKASKSAAIGITDLMGELDAGFGLFGSNASDVESYVKALNSTTKSTSVNVEAQKGFIETSTEVGALFGKSGEEARKFGQSVILATAALEKDPSLDNFNKYQNLLADAAAGNTELSDETKEVIAKVRELGLEGIKAGEISKGLAKTLKQVLNPESSSENPLITELTESEVIAGSLAQQIALAKAELNGGTDAARRLALAFELGLKSSSALPESIAASLTELEKVEAQQVAGEERTREELQKTAQLKSELKAQEAKTTSEFEKLESSFGTELEQIESKLIAERELTKAYFLLELEDAKGNADALLAVEQRKADATAAIEKNASDAKARLEQAKKQTTLGYASSTFGALSSLMNTESRKLFEIGKAAAIGQAIVDGYAAVSKTMASVPYPFNVPLAIAQGAASAVQVQGIAKQKFGGSGGGAGTFSAGMPAVRTTDAGSAGGGGNQNINISGIDRNSLISGGQLVDTLNQALGDGFTINFAGG